MVKKRKKNDFSRTITLRENKKLGTTEYAGELITTHSLN